MLFKNFEYLIVLIFNSELLLNSMKLLVNSKKSFQYPSSEALKRRFCTRNRLQEPLCGPEISYRKQPWTGENQRTTEREASTKILIWLMEQPPIEFVRVLYK